jgi:hypothetical protein
MISSKPPFGLGVTQLDTNKAVVGAVREPPLLNCVTPIVDRTMGVKKILAVIEAMDKIPPLLNLGHPHQYA